MKKTSPLLLLWHDMAPWLAFCLAAVITVVVFGEVIVEIASKFL